MQWGFNHPTKGMLVFNTRSETATLELKNETAKGDFFVVLLKFI